MKRHTKCELCSLSARCGNTAIVEIVQGRRLEIVCLRVLTRTELAKNPKLTLKSINSSRMPKGIIPVQPFDPFAAQSLRAT